MFERASKLGVRFQCGDVSVAGKLSTEDLWSLPLADLDTIAKHYDKLIKESSEESFIVKKNSVDETLELMFKIVKRVIEVRLKEIEDNKKSADKKSRKDLLKSLILEKQNEELRDLSSEELTEMLNNE